MCFWKIGQIYNRVARVEHVDHARRSAQHCVKALLSAQTSTYIESYFLQLGITFSFFGPCWYFWISLMIFRYDYLPYFYSRVFEYEGSTRKVWWQFFGDNGKILVRNNMTYWPFVLFYLLFPPISSPVSHIVLNFHWTVGETVEIGNFDPKIATFWIESGNGLFYCSSFRIDVCGLSLSLRGDTSIHVCVRINIFYLDYYY